MPEQFTAQIPASKFFRPDNRVVDVGEIKVPGRIIKSASVKSEHYTEISLLQLTDLAKRYFSKQPAGAKTGQGDRVSNFSPIERLIWEMQEDLPLSFPEGSELRQLLTYPEPIGMDVYLQ